MEHRQWDIHQETGREDRTMGKMLGKRGEASYGARSMEDLLMDVISDEEKQKGEGVMGRAVPEGLTVGC